MEVSGTTKRYHNLMIFFILNSGLLQNQWRIRGAAPLILGKKGKTGRTSKKNRPTPLSSRSGSATENELILLGEFRC